MAIWQTLAYSDPGSAAPFGLRGLLDAWARTKRRPRLDPRMLGDHLRRDVGLMDGRAPHGGRGENPDWI